MYERVQPLRVGRRHADGHAPDVGAGGGQAGAEALPLVTAVDRAIHPGAHAAVVTVGRLAQVIPQGGVDARRIHGIDEHVGGAGGVVVARQHESPALPAVVAAINAALAAVREQGPGRGNIDALLVGGIDGDARDALALLESEWIPGRAAVR